jgi:hypothetical protein
LADCISGAARFERRYECIAATVEKRSYWLQTFDESDGSIPPDRLRHSQSFKFWRDGPNFRSLWRITSRRMARGQVAERVESVECLVTPKLALKIPRNSSTGQFEGPNLIARSASETNDELVTLLAGIAAFVFAGRIDTSGPGLVERLTAAKPTAADDRLNGRAVVRLDFEDAWGVQSVWFDPARDYHPVRVTQRKQPHHWIRRNVRVDQIPDSSPLGGVTGIEMDIVVTGFRQVQGVWFADGFEVREKYTRNDLKRIDTKEVFRITEISPDPRAGGNQFKVTTLVPNGTPVYFHGLPIRHEWRDGEVIKSVNQPAAKTLSRQEFLTASRWWLWPTTLILAAGCVAFFVRRRRSVLG